MLKKPALFKHINATFKQRQLMNQNQLEDPILLTNDELEREQALADKMAERLPGLNRLKLERMADLQHERVARRWSFHVHLRAQITPQSSETVLFA